MLTLRKFMAACALAHNHDCSCEGWEYDGVDDWFEDVIGVNAIPGAKFVYVFLFDPKTTIINQVSLSAEEVDAAANLVGYLDMF